jgi:starch synthase
VKPRVLLVSSEAVPLAKTGGLADVISALADTLCKQGIDASILMPGYPSAMQSAANLRRVDTLPNLPGGQGILLSGIIPGINVPVILLDTPLFRKRNANPYTDQFGNDHNDNPICFAALAHAAMQICAGRSVFPIPHVVHANDWHAGLIPALLKSNHIRNVGSVLTIHNLAFQGNFAMELASQLGLPIGILNSDGAEYWGKISFLKAGIRFADVISTVSHNYAKEILTPRFGCGFETILQQRQKDLMSIPNGIDTEIWNPFTDPMIARPFSSTDLHGKHLCKQKLKKLFNLSPLNSSAPVLALGSRITHQKMADIALAAMPDLLNRYPQLQVAVLGCGEPEYQSGFEQLAQQYPGRVGVKIGYEETLAHVLHAGADMLLHGSRFEPFGLTPLYAMRYGTIPIASSVGGLVDTIIDAGSMDCSVTGATGFLFDGEQPQDMINAVHRTLACYDIKSEWQKLQVTAMRGSFGWDAPGRQYINMYRNIAAPEFRHLFQRVEKTNKSKYPMANIDLTSQVA